MTQPSRSTQRTFFFLSLKTNQQTIKQQQPVNEKMTACLMPGHKSLNVLPPPLPLLFHSESHCESQRWSAPRFFFGADATWVIKKKKKKNECVTRKLSPGAQKGTVIAQWCKRFFPSGALEISHVRYFQDTFARKATLLGLFFFKRDTKTFKRLIFHVFLLLLLLYFFKK